MKYMFDDDLVVAKQDNKNMHANTHTAYTDLWHASRQPYPQRVDIFSIYLRFCSSDIFCFFFCGRVSLLSLNISSDDHKMNVYYQ